MCMLRGAAGGITPGCRQGVARRVPALPAACQPPAHVPPACVCVCRWGVCMCRWVFARPAAWGCLPFPPRSPPCCPPRAATPRAPCCSRTRGWLGWGPSWDLGDIPRLVGPYRNPSTPNARSHGGRCWGGQGAAGLSLREGTWPHFQVESPVPFGAPREDGWSRRARDGTQRPPQQLRFPNRLH